MGTGTKRGGAPGTATPLVEELAQECQHLGLSPYEARVLLALLSLKTATSVPLAAASGVPRTSTYPVLEELRRKGLVERLPGKAPALWRSVAVDEVMDRLHASAEERLTQHQARAERLRKVLSETISPPDVPLPEVRLLTSAASVRRVFDELFDTATAEILAFSRPPYAHRGRRVNQKVFDALNRGVTVRSLYHADNVEDPKAETYRAEIPAYVEAGVDARVVDELPMKLVVFDRRTALVAIVQPELPINSFASNLLVEDPGFASAQADAFEYRWAKARPFPRGKP